MSTHIMGCVIRNRQFFRVRHRALRQKMSEERACTISQSTRHDDGLRRSSLLLVCEYGELLRHFTANSQLTYIQQRTLKNNTKEANKTRVSFLNTTTWYSNAGRMNEQEESRETNWSKEEQKKCSWDIRSDVMRTIRMIWREICRDCCCNKVVDERMEKKREERQADREDGNKREISVQSTGNAVGGWPDRCVYSVCPSIIILFLLQVSSSSCVSFHSVILLSFVFHMCLPRWNNAVQNLSGFTRRWPESQLHETDSFSPRRWPWFWWTFFFSSIRCPKQANQSVTHKKVYEFNDEDKQQRIGRIEMWSRQWERMWRSSEERRSDGDVKNQSLLILELSKKNQMAETQNDDSTNTSSSSHRHRDGQLSYYSSRSKVVRWHRLSEFHHHRCRWHKPMTIEQAGKRARAFNQAIWVSSAPHNLFLLLCSLVFIRMWPTAKPAQPHWHLLIFSHTMSFSHFRGDSEQSSVSWLNGNIKIQLYFRLTHSINKMIR